LAPKDWVILEIRDEFVPSFCNAIGGETGQEFVKQMEYDVGMLPIMVAPLPVKFEWPNTLSMPKVVEWMNLARVQRQSDEKGLSAWSSGYASVGNPTKIQLRWQRKLSLILGHLSVQQKGEKLIIYDSMYSELEALNHIIHLWQEKVASLKGKRYFFFCPQTEGMASKLEGNITTSTVWDTGYRILFLVSKPIETATGTEWAKVDARTRAQIQEWFGKCADFSYCEKLNIHVTAQMHVLSDELFKAPTSSPLYKKKVFTLGSAHNMVAIVSTLDTLPVGISDGSDAYHFALQQVVPLTLLQYCTRVMQHNGMRSGFHLFGNFNFNPMLNFIRWIPGKTINFTTGTIEDHGISFEGDRTAEFGSEDIEDDTTESDHEDQPDDETVSEDADQASNSSNGAPLNLTQSVKKLASSGAAQAEKPKKQEILAVTF